MSIGKFTENNIKTTKNNKICIAIPVVVLYNDNIIRLNRIIM